jgi:hypothetical protein
MKRKKIIQQIKNGKLAIKKDSKEALIQCLKHLFPHDDYDYSLDDLGAINNTAFLYYMSLSSKHWAKHWYQRTGVTIPHINALELLIKIKGAHGIAEMYKAQARRIDELHEENEKRIEELEKQIEQIKNLPVQFGTSDITAKPNFTIEIKSK